MFDFLFWKQTPGINFAIYVVLCLAGGFYILRTEDQKPAVRALILLAPILFFAAITFIRQEPLTLFVSYVFTLFLMGLLVTTFIGGRWTSYGLADYLLAYLRLTGGALEKPFFLLNLKRQQQAEGTGNPTRKNAWPVVRGILIAIPILLVFSALLSSADLVFAQRLDSLVAMFRLEKLPEYIFRTIYILIGAYLLVGVFLHASLSSKNEKLIGEDKPLNTSLLGFTEAGIVLGSVATLFAMFVVIQFQYFFGGLVNIHLDGYTYAEYARQGFGELITVAFFSLLLFLGLSGITRRETSTQRNVFSGLGITVVVLVGIMLVSAFQRLVLYEAAYGFSRLRTYTHVFMLWLALLLAVVVVLEILRRERLFAFSVLLACLGFAVSLTLINVDGFIVRQNVQRAVEGHELDVAYFASLSSDSIPVLVEKFKDSSLSNDIHEQVGASLVCISDNNTKASSPADWRGFNFSISNGQKLLSSIEQDLKGYQINHTDYQTTVTTPDGKQMDCWGSGIMD
jgi:hypothetical protein